MIGSGTTISYKYNDIVIPYTRPTTVLLIFTEKVSRVLLATNVTYLKQNRYSKFNSGIPIDLVAADQHGNDSL